MKNYKPKTCLRCGKHETSALNDFDEFDVCKSCRSSEQKMRIDWSSRFDKLKDIFEHFKKKKTSSYDCIIPISGGKDSTYQVYLLTKVFNLKPLERISRP